MCWLTDGQMLMPSIFIQLLCTIPGSGTGSGGACHCPLSLKMISVDLLQLRFRLFSSARFCILSSSACWDALLLAGMMIYVSLAYLHNEFPVTAAIRSPAVTTYAAGPMTDPWIMLAVTSSSVDCFPPNTMQWEWLLKKSTNQLEAVFVIILSAVLCQKLSRNPAIWE